MLKIDPSSSRFVPIGERTLSPASFCARYRLADFVANSPEAFFQEAGLPWMLIGRDWPSGPGGARAELVAADRQGRVYVIATQRGSEPLDLMEPLETASRLAAWSPEHIGRRLTPAQRAGLDDFLEVPFDLLNAEQGAALIAETFDIDTLATAGWMRERYAVRLVCVRVRSARDSLTGLDYLVCQDLNSAMTRAYRERRGDALDAAPWPTIFPAEPVAQPAAAPTPQEPADDDWSDAVENVLEAPETPVAPAPTSLDDDPADEELSHLDELADDPLAELVRAHEAAEALPPAVDDPDGRNRRRSERREDFQARRLRLDYLGRLLGARLVDFSEHGIGVEALSPLPVGSEVGISGELVGADRALGIEGRVRVAHCRTSADGVSRIGFSTENARVRPIDADQQAFDRR